MVIHIEDNNDSKSLTIRNVNTLKDGKDDKDL